MPTLQRASSPAKPRPQAAWTERGSEFTWLEGTFRVKGIDIEYYYFNYYILLPRFSYFIVVFIYHGCCY